MDEGRRYEIAIRARGILEKAHTAFMDAVSQITYQSDSPHKLYVENNELIADCLGLRLAAKRRLLVRDGDLMGVEYRFCAIADSEEIEIWKMYLDNNNSISQDALAKDYICQTTNKYLADNLMPKLGVALLSSKVFAQSSDDT